MTELKYGDIDVTKLMFGDTEVSGKPKFVRLSERRSSSISNILNLSITRQKLQELLNQKYTTLIVSYVDSTQSPTFWNLNKPLMLDEFLDTGVLAIQTTSQFPKMELKFVEDDVCLVYPDTAGNRSCYISVGAC